MFLRTAREGEEQEKNHCFVAGAVIVLGALAGHVWPITGPRERQVLTRKDKWSESQGRAYVKAERQNFWAVPQCSGPTFSTSLRHGCQMPRCSYSKFLLFCYSNIDGFLQIINMIVLTKKKAQVRYGFQKSPGKVWGKRLEVQRPEKLNREGKKPLVHGTFQGHG